VESRRQNPPLSGARSSRATNDAANKAVAEERKKAKSKVRVYDGFPIRRWDKWLDDVQTHLFVMPADGSAPARDLLAGTKLVERSGFSGAFSEGANDDLQPAWTPDSRSVVFTATTNLNAAAHNGSHSPSLRGQGGGWRTPRAHERRCEP
jgi:hypothetical protein